MIKYILTYDFRIIYCKNINLRIGLKELNFNNLTFIPISDYNDSILDCGYDMSTEDVQTFITTIFNSKMGYQLEEKNMQWLKVFESKMKSENLLKDNKLAFNYFVLKLMLIGFVEKKAISIAERYFELLIDGYNVPDIKDVIDKVNKFIDYKEFWVSNKLYETQALEMMFITKLLKARMNLKYSFDFANFKEEYFKLCNKSLIMDNYVYNTTPSYLVKNPIGIEEQEPYLIQLYQTTIVGILNHLISTDFKELASDDRFINSLASELINVIHTFIDSQIKNII